MKEKDEFRRKGSPGDPGTDPNNRVSGSPMRALGLSFIFLLGFCDINSENTKPKRNDNERKKARMEVRHLENEFLHMIFFTFISFLSVLGFNVTTTSKTDSI